MTLTAVAPEAPTCFALDLPEGWLGIDIARAMRSGLVAKLVDRRIAEVPELAKARSQIVRTLKELVAQAHEQGATYCAANVEDYGTDGVFIASLAVIIMDADQVGQAMAAAGQPLASPSVEVIASQISTRAQVQGSDADWQHVRIVQLPAGPAVRVEAVSTIGAADGYPTQPRPASFGAPPAPEGPTLRGLRPQVRWVTMQNLLPIPGTDTVLNLVFNSPHVVVAEALLNVFDAISSTLSFPARTTTGGERLK